MVFREFLDALNSVSGEKVNAKSTREFLSEITESNFRSILANMPDTKFQGSLRYERNISEELAREVLASYDRKYLINYLNEDLCCEFKDKQKLCEAFKKYSSTINTDNVFELIAEQFEKILNTVCKGEVKKKVSISKTDLKKIHELVVELQCVVRKIENSLQKYEKKCRKFPIICDYIPKDEFESLQEEFHKMNMELQLYNKIYPELEIIDEIIEMADLVEMKLPTEANKHNIILGDNGIFEEYENFLDRFIKSIHNK